MKKIMISAILLIINLRIVNADSPDSTSSASEYFNTAELMLLRDGKLNIGAYGEVHYNQPIAKSQKETGILDVHRVVMFLGYNFSRKTQFVSEIEFEHVNEIWVEQAFLQQRISQAVNFRAGLLLVPMGIINEFHEPTSFNGVERPVIDSKISPSTWSEIGLGFSGNLQPANLKYQIYLISGLNGYDTKGIFNGSSGLRDGRQKGSKAYISSPAVTGKLEYYGIRNLNIGISAYTGRSQSKLYNKLPDDDSNRKQIADSSSVGIAMIGADARYRKGGLELRGQIYYNILSNTEQYNIFTRKATINNDLGKEMSGFYIEAGYNVFRHFRVNHDLVPFLRYEYYNMHHSTDKITTANLLYKNNLITTGITFRLTNNAVMKCDMQLIRSAADNEYRKTVNAGFGIVF